MAVSAGLVLCALVKLLSKLTLITMKEHYKNVEIIIKSHSVFNLTGLNSTVYRL